MKIKLSLVLILIGTLCSGLSAQSVVITGKKITYTRKNPISDYKKAITINYPKVKAATPALSRKIENAISYGTDLKEVNDIQWLDEADYEVGYNQNGVLSIALTINGSGAYPSGSTRHVVANLKTGARLQPADVFTNLSELLALVGKAKDKEVAQAIADIKKDPENSETNASELFFNAQACNPLNLKDFGINAFGVTFYYDYEFPHVIQAMQPSGEFTFTWKQLKPYIKPHGLLGQFVR